MFWVGLTWLKRMPKTMEDRQECTEKRRRKERGRRLVAPRTEVMPDGGSGAWRCADGGVLADKSPAPPEARKSRVLMRISPPKKGKFWLALPWVGLAWLDLAWVGLDRIGLDWIELNWVWLGLIGLIWLDLGWVGLNWIELNWVVLFRLGWVWLDWIEFGWIVLLGLLHLRCLGWIWLDWIELNWVGLCCLGWVGLDWVELRLVGLCCCSTCTCNTNCFFKT